MPLDTIGAIGDYDPGTGVVTIHTNTMNFTYFLWLIAGSLKVPANKLRLVPVPAGGSFGSKFFMHKVPTFAGFLSMLVGRPVKYVEDRVDHIVNNDHCGSDRLYDASLAFDDDGESRRCGSRRRRLRRLPPVRHRHHGNALSQIVGPYRIQHVEYSLAAVLTNKNQQGAYRGFGAEVSNWMLERLVDMAARELGLDRVEIRRRNLIAADSFPYRTPTGNIYDSGNYQGVLEKVLEEADYDHWVADREQARGGGPPRRHRRRRLPGAQRLQLDGVLVLVRRAAVHADVEPRERERPRSTRPARSSSTLHSQSLWGNSPETVVAQVVAEEFDVDPASVVVTYADSQNALPGTGPGGSRYTVMVSGAVAGRRRSSRRRSGGSRATCSRRPRPTSSSGRRRRRRRARRTGSCRSPRSRSPRTCSGSTCRRTWRAGSRRSQRTTTRSRRCRPPTARTSASSTPSSATPATSPWSRSTPRPAGDVPPLRRRARRRTLVNPRTLAGHITGGTVQGIGTALHEEFVYDDEGSVLPQLHRLPDPDGMEVPR